MIEFHDWTIAVSGLLARQYDNRSRRVEVVGDLPEGWEWELLVQVGDAMDIIRLSPMEGGVGHTLMAEQVSIPGYYTVQLRGRQGEVVRHTNTVQCFVSKSLSGDAKWPELPSEFSQAEERIAQLNAHPPKPGTNGFWLLWDADRDEYVTSTIPLPVGGGGGSAEGAVLYVPQALSEEQRGQARDNIGAAPKLMVVSVAGMSESDIPRANYNANQIIEHAMGGGYAVLSLSENGGPVGFVSQIDPTRPVVVFDLLMGIDGLVVVHAAVDAEGNITTTIDDLAGTPGEPGSPGERGEQGDPGPEGPPGADGIDGYTPQKGVDYWTQEDRQEIVDEVLAALPAAEGVGF